MEQNPQEKQYLLQDKNHKLSYDNWVTNVSFVEKDNTLVATQEFKVNIYNIQDKNDVITEEQKFQISSDREQITCIEVCKEANLLATGSVDKFTRIYSLQSGMQKYISESEGVIQTLAFYRKKTDTGNKQIKTLLLIGSMERKIRIIDCDNGLLANILQGHDQWIQNLKFSEDQLKLVSGDMKGNLKLWDVQTFKNEAYPQITEKHSLSDSKNYYLSLQFQKNQQKYYLHTLSSNRQYILYSVYKDQVVKDQQVELPSDLYVGAFSQSCVYYVYGSQKGDLVVYNLQRQEQMQRIEKGHNSSLFCVRFSDEYKYLITGGIDKQCIVWKVGDGLKVAKNKQNKKSLFEQNSVVLGIVLASLIVIILAVIFN